MSDHAAIKVEHVGKTFLRPHERYGTMKRAFLSAIRSRAHGHDVQVALRDISFEVQPGEFFGIVGRNGSGKSTLLKILAGIYQPNHGNVDINGRLVPFIELGVGFNDELTGRENVYLNGALLGFSEAEIDQLYADIVDFAELSGFMDQKLKNYSSGMQVRLAFSLATRAQADILLVDEVLAVGDADFQRKCFDYFRQLKKRGTTVIFVTHDMDAVREYCDRAILINDSHLEAEGSAQDIAESYAQLFADSRSNKPIETGKRWGSDELHYDSVEVAVDKDADRIIIEADIAAGSTIDVPVFGFSVQAGDGTAVLGTNTLLQHHRIEKIKEGEKFHISWSFANILSDGNYTVTITSHDTSGSVVYDWWNDAAGFRVNRSRQVAYPVDPPIELELTPGKS